MVQNRIREERLAQGKLQYELAEKAGLSPQSVCYAEKPSVSPRLEHLSRIAGALDCSIDSLIVR